MKGEDVEQNKYSPVGCTLCNIYDFMECGITTLKISGRGMNLTSRLSLMNLTRKVLKVANETNNGDEVRQKVIDLCSELYPNCYCMEHKGCYIV